MSDEEEESCCRRFLSGKEILALAHEEDRAAIQKYWDDTDYRDHPELLDTYARWAFVPNTDFAEGAPAKLLAEQTVRVVPPELLNPDDPEDGEVVVAQVTMYPVEELVRRLEADWMIWRPRPEREALWAAQQEKQAAAASGTKDGK